MNKPPSSSSNSSPFYFCEPEFCELLWENGQIVTQPTPKFPQLSRHDHHADADDDNSTVPWMHEHDPLPLSSPLPLPSDDFCSDFIEGFAGATSSSMAFGFAFPAPLSNFKDRLASGARASTSTKHTDTITINYAQDPAANQDQTTTTTHVHVHDQPLLPVAPNSSVCSSVNDEGTHNTGPNRDPAPAPAPAPKRKIMQAHHSTTNNEDMHDDSAGDKTIPTGRSSSAKKSRAAQVHNLSERRRRERINEKMKALQELIPNCSKADKASMLDDAIEYLKTLQLQVQMMSMGNGMYMARPVMVPPAMMRPPHMAHYSSLGMGLYQMQMPMQPQPIPPIPMHGINIAPVPVVSNSSSSSSEKAANSGSLGRKEGKATEQFN